MTNPIGSRCTLLTIDELRERQPDRATRVTFHGTTPEDARLWRKWILEQGMPSKPNRAQRRHRERLVARARNSPNVS